MKISRLTIILICLQLSGCFLIPKSTTPVKEIDYPEGFRIIKRQEWGWQPKAVKTIEQSIDKITIHHGGVEFPEDKDPVQYLKNLQSWSRSEKKWVDIPYHWMIDLEGNIYEARPCNYPGDTNTDYDVRGHALICIMGNYEVQKINEAQLAAVADICAFLAKKFDIAVDDIRGHKDYTETACPGADLYKYLSDGTIHGAINAKLAE